MPSIGDLANVFSRESFSTAGGGGGGAAGAAAGAAAAPPSSSSPGQGSGGGEAVELTLTAVPSYSRWPSNVAVAPPAPSSSTALPPRHHASNRAAVPPRDEGNANDDNDEQYPPVNYHSSWDSDSQFPIREIERIRRKTRKIRSSRGTSGAGASEQPHSQQSQSGSGTAFDSSDWEEDTLDAKVRAFEEGRKQQQQQQRRHQQQQPDRAASTSNRPPPTSNRSNSNNNNTSSTSSSSGNLGPPTIRRHHAWSDDVSKLSGTQEEEQASEDYVSPYGTSRAAQDAARNLMENFRKPGSSSRLLLGAAGGESQRSLRSRPPQPQQLPPQSQSQSQRFQAPVKMGSTSQGLAFASNAAHDTSAETVDDSYDGTHYTSTTVTSEGAAGSTSDLLQLHDLCGEAVTSDDVAWNNALHLLSVRPELAKSVDQGWTPLHICCLASCEPPLFLIRALLYVYPAAARMPDDGGRLPLHLAAASSASPSLMRALVTEYPASVTHVDDHGLTPLHLWLRNLRVPLGFDEAHILLGRSTFEDEAEESSRPPPTSNESPSGVVLRRRRQHLNLTLEQLEPLLSRNRRPVVTTLNRNLRQRKGRYQKDMDHESAFVTYKGADVQASLSRLVKWKRHNTVHRTGGPNDDEDSDEDQGNEAIEVQLPSSAPHMADPNAAHSNPAAIPAPSTRHLPLHTLLYRAIVDKSELEKGTGTESHDAPTARKTPSKLPSPSSSSDSDEEEEEIDEEVPTSSARASALSEEETVDMLRLFIACYPGALATRDVHGLTPLLVVLVEAKSIPPLDVVELLLGSKWPAYSPDVVIPEWAEDLPLHQLSNAGRGAGSTALFPAMMPTVETRQLPLHIVAEEMPPEMIEVVVEAYPAAREAQDHLGRTPLHVALTSYRRMAVPPRVVAMLYSDRVARIRDDHGMLPFDVLLDRCCAGSASLPDKPPRSWTHDDAVVGEESPSAAASAVYHRFLSNSIMGAAKPRTPVEAADFLRRLRCLPPWLREHACSTLVVQDLIVEDVTSPAKFFLVLFEGVLIIALITVFRLQMEQFVVATDNQEDLSTWYTFAVYAAATVRLMLELARWFVAASLGEFRHLVLFDVSSWINVVSLFLVITTSILLYGSRSDAELYSLGTATTGALWLSLFGYLSNWWYGASIFIGGLSKIACCLVWPCLIFGSVIVAFSQMFYTLLQVNCEDSMGTPVCTVRDAYRVVYMIVRGEPLVDGIRDISLRAVVLIALLLLSILLFMVGLFVMLMVASLKLDFETTAWRSFWEKKLAFYYTIEDLGVPDWLLSSQCGWNAVGVSARLERAWNLLVISVIGGSSRKQKHWYEGVPGSDISSWPLWIVAIFVIPVWVALGAATLGLLWPPQLRRLLFRPLGFHSLDGGHAPHEQTSVNVSAMRDEVRQLKAATFERSGEVERELRELKELLHAAMKES